MSRRLTAANRWTPSGREVLLDAGPKSIGLVVGENATAVVAARADLAHDREVIRVRVQGLTDQLVHHTRPVVLRRVDVVDPGTDRRTQHAQRLVTVTGRPEDVVTGQLHGAVSDPVDLPAAESE